MKSTRWTVWPALAVLAFVFVASVPRSAAGQGKRVSRTHAIENFLAEKHFARVPPLRSATLPRVFGR